MEKDIRKGKVVRVTISEHDKDADIGIVFDSEEAVGVVVGKRVREGYEGARLVDYKVKIDGRGERWMSSAWVDEFMAIWVGERIGKTVGICDNCGERKAIRRSKLSRQSKTEHHLCGECLCEWDDEEDWNRI